jgi:hypothetical protein
MLAVEVAVYLLPQILLVLAALVVGEMELPE